jgi:hypothetical protein
LATVDDRVPVPQFVDEYKRRPLALEELKKHLDAPRPSGADVTVINLVDYRGIEEELDSLKRMSEEEQAKTVFLYGFDLKRVAGGLKRASENEAQRTYVLTLNVVAVDTNVEADRPGIGQNKETMVFKLVSDGELLTEIAREEAQLADKLDDAIRRLTDVDAKLRSMVARIPGLQQPDQFVPEQTRANELGEQLTKSKDVTGEVFTDYSRILREFRVNRLPKHLIDQMSEKVVNKLGDVHDTDFPQTEEQYGKFHGELSANRQPPPELVFNVQQKITVLLAKLREIRAGIGQGLDIKKLITLAEQLIKDETLVADGLKQIGRSQTDRLTQITITPPNAPVSVTAGQKTTVKIPVDIGAAYNGTFALKAEASPGSDLKVPATISLKEDDKEFNLEITAGFNKGLHWIRVIPDAGPAKDVRVIVK